MDPKEQNHIADFYSRINDMNNWSIDDGIFNIINYKYGPFSVDKIANNLNEKSVFNGYPKFIATLVLNSSSSHNSSYYI